MARHGKARRGKARQDKAVITVSDTGTVYNRPYRHLHLSWEFNLRFELSQFELLDHKKKMSACKYFIFWSKVICFKILIKSLISRISSSMVCDLFKKVKTAIFLATGASHDTQRSVLLYRSNTIEELKCFYLLPWQSAIPDSLQYSLRGHLLPVTNIGIKAPHLKSNRKSLNLKWDSASFKTYSQD